MPMTKSLYQKFTIATIFKTIPDNHKTAFTVSVDYVDTTMDFGGGGKGHWTAMTLVSD